MRHSRLTQGRWRWLLVLALLVQGLATSLPVSACEHESLSAQGTKMHMADQGPEAGDMDCCCDHSLPCEQMPECRNHCVSTLSALLFGGMSRMKAVPPQWLPPHHTTALHSVQLTNHYRPPRLSA